MTRTAMTPPNIALYILIILSHAESLVGGVVTVGVISVLVLETTAKRGREIMLEAKQNTGVSEHAHLLGLLSNHTKAQRQCILIYYITLAISDDKYCYRLPITQYLLSDIARVIIIIIIFSLIH